MILDFIGCCKVISLVVSPGMVGKICNLTFPVWPCFLFVVVLTHEKSNAQGVMQVSASTHLH